MACFSWQTPCPRGVFRAILKSGWAAIHNAARHLPTHARTVRFRTDARPPAVVALLLLVASLSAREAGARQTGAPTTPTAATAPDTASPRLVRVCAGGDVTLATNLDTSWAPFFARKYKVRSPALPNPDALLAPLRPLLRDADVVLLNVEGAIGRGRAPSKCGPHSTACFALRMPPAAAPALRRVGGRVPVVGNVANNHARDAGPAGFDSTRARLTRARVRVTGADTLATVVATRRGDTVAFLGFSTSGEPDARDLEGVRRHVARAAARHARVVVTAHIGAEGVAAQRTRDTVERFYGADRGNPVAFAHAAVDAGADLVIGHGPHVLRAAEWYGDALVLYSLGNLVTYGPFAFAEPIARGALACVQLDASGRVEQAELRATRQRRPGRVAVDRDRRAAVLVDSLSRLDFPETGARVSSRGLISRPEADSLAPDTVGRSTRVPRGGRSE